MSTKPENVAYITCSKCLIEKQLDKFYKRGQICCDCNNEKRRQKYKNDEEKISMCAESAPGNEYKNKRKSPVIKIESCLFLTVVKFDS